jgi:hypothetical protein
LGSLLLILGRGFRIVGTWLGRQFLILGSGLLLGSLGSLLGFDIIRIAVDMLEEFVARWEGFLILPICKCLANRMVCLKGK